MGTKGFLSPEVTLELEQAGQKDHSSTFFTPEVHVRCSRGATYPGDCVRFVTLKRFWVTVSPWLFSAIVSKADVGRFRLN